MKNTTTINPKIPAIMIPKIYIVLLQLLFPDYTKKLYKKLKQNNIVEQIELIRHKIKYL